MLGYCILYGLPFLIKEPSFLCLNNVNVKYEECEVGKVLEPGVISKINNDSQDTY